MFSEWVGVAQLRQTFERFDAILAFQTRALQQSDINKLAARRGNQLLIGKPAEHISRRSRTLGEKEGFSGRLFIGRRSQTEGNHATKNESADEIHADDDKLCLSFPGRYSGFCFVYLSSCFIV